MWFGLLAVLGASAADMAEWKWAQPHRYHIGARMNVPQTILLTAQRNTEVRVPEVLIDMVTTCTGEASGKKAWDIRCTIDELGIQARPASGERGDLSKVLEEMDASLSSAQVEFTLSRDGRMRSFALKGIQATDRESSARLEIWRSLMQRVFSPFDLKLPKTLSSEASWTADNLALDNLISQQGTMGTVNVTFKVTGVEGSIYSIQGAGKGTVASGEMIQIAGQEQPKDHWALNHEESGKFDYALGTWTEREALVDALPTASSLTAHGTAGVPYVLGVRMVHIAAGTSVAVIPTGILASE